MNGQLWLFSWSGKKLVCISDMYQYQMMILVQLLKNLEGKKQLSREMGMRPNLLSEIILG